MESRRRGLLNSHGFTILLDASLVLAGPDLARGGGGGGLFWFSTSLTIAIKSTLLMTVLTMLASSQVVARYCLGVATLTFPDLVLTYTVTRLITVRVFTTFIVTMTILVATNCPNKTLADSPNLKQ